MIGVFDSGVGGLSVLREIRRLMPRADLVYIADQAEFTPRNVQTVEGRKSTVFAIRLSISNPDLALKPGMPADVTLNQ